MNLKKTLKNILGKGKNTNLDVGRSNEKNRQIWLEETLKAIPKGKKILDAGAGELQYKRLCQHLEYESQDFAEYKPNEIEDGLQKKDWDYGKLDMVSDIASIPRDDDFYDAIMCIEVLEHVVNPREAIKEFSRLMKKGGTLIISAPFCSLTHFAPYHFYSGFNKFFYETELKNNGFEIVKIEANGNYFEYMAQELHRLPKVSKRYGNTTLSSVELDTINKLKHTLKELSNKDSNSEELLCYGYHVLAKKI